MALEFNVFAKDEAELGHKQDLLVKAGFKVLTSKLLDTPTLAFSEGEAIAGGVALFNEERFWEAHEVLEQAWRSAQGVERETIQSLILTCAAFVHYQKGENEICISVLRRARSKMHSKVKILPFDMETLKSNVDAILSTGNVRLFKLRRREIHPFRKRTTSAATKIVRARPPARRTPGSG